MKPKIGRNIVLVCLTVFFGWVIWQFVLMNLPTTMGKELRLGYQPDTRVEICRRDGGRIYGLTLSGEDECRAFLEVLSPIEIATVRQDSAKDFLWTVTRVDGETAMLICAIADDGRIYLNALYYDTRQAGELTALLEQTWDRYAERIEPVDTTAGNTP